MVTLRHQVSHFSLPPVMGTFSVRMVLFTFPSHTRTFLEPEAAAPLSLICWELPLT